MKVPSFNHLPVADQLSFIRLLIHCDGQKCLRDFERVIKEALK